MDAGSAGVSPATPEGRIGHRQTILLIRPEPAEARICRGSRASQTTHFGLIKHTLRPVSSTRMTSGLYSVRLPTAHRAISLRDSAWSIPSLAMNRCVPRSTAAGFPANGGFLTAALRPHPFSLAIPTLKAASALDWDLDGCGMRFRISSVHWRRCGLLVHGAAFFWSSGAPIMERPLPRANLFSNSSQKAPRSQPFTGEG